MDALQFGRWVHERRRACGFSSQRALLERIQQDHALAVQGFSEAFLARLEAGLLAHPFRGAVRQRVLGLAELFCRSTRDVSTYLRNAGLSELDAREAEQVQHLRARLSIPSSPRPLLLPPRPSHLFGRQDALAELLAGARHKHAACFLISGMTGVGKSALAAEALHQLALDEALFPAGILSFSCRGYQGNTGLIALCAHLLEALGAAESRSKLNRHSALSEADKQDEHTVSSVINQVRIALAGKSLLLLLDNLDAQFPLRQALEAFTGHAQQCVVLATSHYQFTPVITTHHLPLKPLSPDAACDYLLALLARPLDETERGLLPQLCAAVGHLPLALESLGATCAAGVPLALIATGLHECTLAPLLENELELTSRLAHFFGALELTKQQRFALLSLLNTTSVGLEWAAAVRAGLSVPLQDSAAHLSETALELGYFVRHSLLDVQPAEGEPSRAAFEQTRYQLHPVLRAYGQRWLRQMDSVYIASAERNIRDYALLYVQRHRNQVHSLLRERDLLYACFTQALQAEQYADVVRFVDGLAPISCRLRTREEGTHLFRTGIQACQHLHDRAQQARFISNFGWLLCHRGAFSDAFQAWTESIELLEHTAHPYWQPLLSLAHAAHIQQHEELAAHYAETYLQRAEDHATPLQLSYARILLALYRRLQGKRDAASTHLDAAEELLTPYDGSTQTQKAFITWRLHLERARIEDDYAATLEPMDSLLTFLQQEEEHYDYADILLDQVLFAHEQGQEQEALTMASRIMHAARQVDASYMYQRGLNQLFYSQHEVKANSSSTSVYAFEQIERV